jgi:predicted RNA binding protein YcfA (HicA-like mRNA interferase family)
MSSRLPTLTPKQVLKALTKRKAGFYLCHTSSSGSHIHLCHPDDPTILVDIPMHAQDLKRGTLQSILKQAKLTREEFLKILRDP